MYTVIGKTFLVDKILHVVDTIGVVKIEQIMRMFRLYGESTVLHQLATLAAAHKVNYDRDGGIISSRVQLMRDEGAQEMLTYAFWVLATFGDEKIDSFWLREAPSQLLWIERDTNIIRDITVMHYSNLDLTGYLWITTHNTLLPKIEADDGTMKSLDICEHIALLYDESDMEAAMKYGFDRYCFLSKDEFIPNYYPPIDEPALERSPL